MHVLVVGGTGYLGRRLVDRALRAGWSVGATRLAAPPTDERATWVRLDVRDRAAAAETLAGLRPDVVVNAAYVQSDWATTAQGPAHLALAAAASGARLVHVSSDVVFSGAASPYAEDAVPDPVTPYGAAKAAAETAVAAIDPTALVARTSLIVGDGDSVHERRVHDVATSGAGVLFTDDVRCPIHVDDLAAALLELAEGDRSGVVHLGGADAVSRHELGVLVARRDGLDPARLPRGRRAELGPPAPLDVRLDSRRTQAGLRSRLRGVREALSPAGCG